MHATASTPLSLPMATTAPKATITDELTRRRSLTSTAEYSRAT